MRMLREGSSVALNLRGSGSASMQLQGNRNPYLDDNGALAGIFLPGELTQSLCSPWTHDFRDCGCFYWSSNHPDIAQPPLPTPTTNDPRLEFGRAMGAAGSHDRDGFRRLPQPRRTRVRSKCGIWRSTPAGRR